MEYIWRVAIIMVAYFEQISYPADMNRRAEERCIVMPLNTLLSCVKCNGKSARIMRQIEQNIKTKFEMRRHGVFHRSFATIKVLCSRHVE